MCHWSLGKISVLWIKFSNFSKGKWPKEKIALQVPWQKSKSNWGAFWSLVGLLELFSMAVWNSKWNSELQLMLKQTLFLAHDDFKCSEALHVDFKIFAWKWKNKRNQPNPCKLSYLVEAHRCCVWKTLQNYALAIWGHRSTSEKIG